MKKFILPILLLIYIGIIVILNYIYPIINAFIHINYNPFLFDYFLIIVSYLCVVALIWIENKNLEEFHIDRLSLVILIIFAFIRINYNVPYEIYFKVAIFILGSVLAILFIVNFRRIPQTKPRWILIGVLSCLLVIPFAYIDSLNPVIKPDSAILTQSFIWNATLSAQGVLSFVSPYEELIYRSILWGQLRKWGWTNKKILLVQAILFWLVHFWEAFSNPFTFFILLPITILVTSLLVYYSKQIFPSILFHTACDALVVMIVRFFMR
jgi:membrane protease YdiL (CAAX protease family)